MAKQKHVLNHALRKLQELSADERRRLVDRTTALVEKAQKEGEYRLWLFDNALPYFWVTVEGGEVTVFSTVVGRMTDAEVAEAERILKKAPFKKYRKYGW